MASNDFINRITAIYNLEKNNHPNWDDEISRMSLEIISELHDSANQIEPELYKYLDDFDIRKTDTEYAKFQLTKVERILRSLR